VRLWPQSIDDRIGGKTCHEKREPRAAMAAELSMSEDGIKSLLRRIRAVLAECVRGRLAAEEA
jgi:hypothetical protein